MGEALGMIETRGLVAIIEATDAMAKAADVELDGWAFIGGALVHLVVRGDVASVEAAIAAGKVAAERVGKLVAAHVIARPHDGLAKLLP